MRYPLDFSACTGSERYQFGRVRKGNSYVQKICVYKNKGVVVRKERILFESWNGLSEAITKGSFLITFIYAHNHYLLTLI